MRARLLMGAAVVGVLMQLIGRSQIACSSWRAQEGYKVVIFVGIAATSFAAACALFLFLRRRSRRSIFANCVALTASMLVFVSLGFYGIYWPWMHSVSGRIPVPRMPWLDSAMAILASREMLRSEVYELPPAFRGWVHIAVEMPDCPPLDMRDGVTYFRVGSDGTVCTLGARPPGTYVAKYVYRDENRTELKQTGWGSGGMIRGGSDGVLEQGGKRYRFFDFFVGTEREFKASPRP